MSGQHRGLRLRIGLVVLAGLAVLAVGIPGLVWQLGVPYEGVSLEWAGSGRAVVTSVDSGSTSQAAGVQPGDTLLSVGRVQIPASGAGELGLAAAQHEIVNVYREGERADWVVIRDGRRRTLSASFEGLPGSVVVSRAVVVGVFVLLGWFLLWARPDRKHVRHLVYTIFAIGASVLLLANREMAVTTPLGFAVQQARILGGFLGPALVVHFGVIFPVCALSDRVRRRVLIATYGLYFVASFLVQQAVFVRALTSPASPYMLTPPALEALHYQQIALWLHVLDYVACGGFMLWNYRRIRDEAPRDQIKWVLWAVLLTAATDTLMVGAVLYLEGFGFSSVYPFRNYLYLLIAGGLLVAIFRHDLFNVDAVIRGTVVYFGTVTALFLLFAGTEAIVSEALEDMLPTRSETVAAASAAVLSGALFQPLRAWIQKRMLGLLPVDPEEEVIG